MRNAETISQCGYWIEQISAQVENITFLQRVKKSSWFNNSNGTSLFGNLLLCVCDNFLSYKVPWSTWVYFTSTIIFSITSFFQVMDAKQFTELYILPKTVMFRTYMHFFNSTLLEYFPFVHSVPHDSLHHIMFDRFTSRKEVQHIVIERSH